MPWVGNREIDEQTVEEAARTYVDVLHTEPNVWGRCQHEVYGDSSNVSYLMRSAFGAVAFEAAVNAEFEARRTAEKSTSEFVSSPRM